MNISILNIKKFTSDQLKEAFDIIQQCQNKQIPKSFKAGRDYFFSIIVRNNKVRLRNLKNDHYVGTDEILDADCYEQQCVINPKTKKLEFYIEVYQGLEGFFEDIVSKYRKMSVKDQLLTVETIKDNGLLKSFNASLIANEVVVLNKTGFIAPERGSKIKG